MRRMKRNASLVLAAFAAAAVVASAPPRARSLVLNIAFVSNYGTGPAPGHHAFVAANGDNHVAMIDLKTWQLATRLQAGAGPDGMTWVR
jgi:hypothetical protein